MSRRSNSFRCGSSTRRYFMLSPEDNGELIISTTIASLSYWPDFNNINEVITWIIGLSFVFVGTSLLSNGERGQQQQQQQQLAVVTPGVDVNVTGNNNDGLLTPGTYADSNLAERLVTDTVVAKASEAFDSTDFKNEPHLSPELEDIEAAFEVALLANAAHAMADAAEKENRQSKAAMLERDKELEWIEHHDEGESNLGIDLGTSRTKEKFQRSLLAAQLANKSIGRVKNKEAFQRSLLSSRIALDIKSRARMVEQQRNMEAMECDSAAVGSVDDLHLSVDRSAPVDAVYNENTVVEATHRPESDERIIVGDDRNSLLEHSGISEEIMQEESADDPAENDNSQLVAQADTIFVQDQWEVGNESFQFGTIEDSMNTDNTQLVVQAKAVYQPDQWKKDNVNEVRKFIHQKAIEKTKKKMMLKITIEGDKIGSAENIDIANTFDEDQSKEIHAKEINSESSSVMKLFTKRTLMRRMPRRRRLLVVALGIVITRRLFLAYFGNALSMI